MTTQHYFNVTLVEGAGHRFGVTDLIDVGTVRIDLMQAIREVVMAHDDRRLNPRENGFDPRELIGWDVPPMCVIRRFVGGCRGIETDDINTANTVHKRSEFAIAFGPEPSIWRYCLRINLGGGYIVVSRDSYNGGRSVSSSSHACRNSDGVPSFVRSPAIRTPAAFR